MSLMVTIDTSLVRNILTNEQSYTQNQADLLTRDINPLQNELEETLSNWMQDRTITNYNVEGLNMNHLIQNNNRNFIPALGLLNKLLDTEKIPSEVRKKWIENLIASTKIDFTVDK